MNNYFYDQNNIRCNLIQSKSGKMINWLFVPGGPGADSRYFKGLIEILNLPGNVWLIDLPGNGDHMLNVDLNYNYDRWFDIFKDLVSSFDNPVVVGHSFGAILVLLIPELEKKLAGFVSLNSAPSLWMEEAAKTAIAANKPDLTADMGEFVKNPNQATFDRALEACLPYYFPDESIGKGRELLVGLPFRFEPAVWCQNKVVELNYSAKWYPTEMPMLILNSDQDYICPPALFKLDPRFQRSNVTSIVFEGAGHFPWIEKPNEVSAAFKEFTDKVLNNTKSPIYAETLPL